MTSGYRGYTGDLEPSGLAQGLGFTAFGSVCLLLTGLMASFLFSSRTLQLCVPWCHLHSAPSHSTLFLASTMP